ncbi:MAG: FAD-dependent oxidoreductase [Clostridia bacterium]|nr:FAD-dependent oxidoreductase [Clostridia bacterium]
MTNKTYTCDVVVCGAGTAGAVAAIAAADQGKNVILIEQYGIPGGSATLSLVTPLMRTGIKGNPMCSYISDEINRRAVETGASIDKGDIWLDPMMLGIILEEMLMERGVKVLYHTTIIGAEKEGNSVTCVNIFNKSGHGKVFGKVFIDATGDADVCALLELPMLHGNEEDGKNQPVSLRYVLGGVDTDAFWAFYSEKDTGAPTPRPVQYHGAVTTDERREFPLRPLFFEAIEKGDLVYDDAVYWQFFTVPGRADAIAFNCPEFFDFHDADDAENLTFVQLEGKKAIVRQLKFYRKYIPGFEKAYIAQISTMVGIRESRRAVTDHIITNNECLAHMQFDDAICQSNYPVDIHGRKLNTYDIIKDSGKPYYEIPLRALIVKDVDNLLVAGRNLGAEFVAQSSIRVIPTCRAMGEAAGICASLAIDEGRKSLHGFDGARVREEMIARGAKFAD